MSASPTVEGARPPLADDAPDRPPPSPGLYTVPESLSYLLDHQVPSASLCLEDLLGSWSWSGDAPTPTSAGQGHVRRRSVALRRLSRLPALEATGLNGGDEKQPYPRSPSLLPPPPTRLPRGRFDMDQAAVDCLLSAGTSGLERREFEVSSSSISSSPGHAMADRDLGRLPSHPDSDTSSLPSTRPITPVPSLTHSHSSQSTSADDVHSPSSLITVAMECCHFHLDSNSSEVVDPHASKSSKGPGARETNAPILLRPFCPDNGMDVAVGRRDVGQRHDHPAGALPHLSERPSLEGWPRDARDSSPDPEISYIDWDDDEEEWWRPGPRLARMRRSFSDLRAADRFASDSRKRKPSPMMRKSEEQNRHPGPWGFRAGAAGSHDRPVFRPVVYPKPAQPSSGSTRPLLRTLSPSIMRRPYRPVKLRKRCNLGSLSTIQSQSQSPSPPASPPQSACPSPRQSVDSGVRVEAPIVATQGACSPAAPSPSTRKRKRSPAGLRYDRSRTDKKQARLTGMGRWMRRLFSVRPKP